MTLPPSFADPAFRIYLTLVQYPILRVRIRARMEEELFKRGIISPSEFQQQIREQAIESQLREGLTDPFGEEPEDTWRTRMNRVRTYLIDLHFAHNLSYELFEEILRQALEERGAGSDWLTTFNAELAPQELLFEQATRISRMPAEERQLYEARLQELKVVMIRNMISDQLAYIKIAKNWFTLDDLIEIRERKIGKGKIGGKAAGMLLAQRILTELADDDIKDSISIPESFFLAADVMYAFMAYNNLLHWNDQKYKTADQIRYDYPRAVEEYLASSFPPDIENELREVLERLGSRPVIVRSSSLLEDNFGTSFAGKYESHFCPNQGTPEENFHDFCQAIKRIYASVINPDPLLYRRSKDLQDYDERIAILIQEVQGEQFGDYFFPFGAGVAFSQNLYRWSPKIDRQAGFLRLVWGLGTRAVDRVGSDFPRLVALSHPLLHSQADVRNVRHYTQSQIDLIDLKENRLKTMGVREVLNRDYPYLPFLAHLFHDGYLSPIRSALLNEKADDLVINFDEMLRRTPFANRMQRILKTLENEYHLPVDMEFTLEVVNPRQRKPDVHITILQCRPQSQLQESEVSIPEDLWDDEIVFTTEQVMLHGLVEEVDYVLFVSPEGYYELPAGSPQLEIARVVGRVNNGLENERFICVGPGRWGTTNPELGVKVGYADIYHARALVELSGTGIGPAPEPSFGTHFFQDLLEASIYPLAILLDDHDAVFNRSFFYQTPNRLAEMFPEESRHEKAVRLIRVNDHRAGGALSLVMDGKAGKAVAYLYPKGQTHVKSKQELL